MDTTNRYLDAVKARLGVTSDNQLAEHWHVTRQRIYQYRRGDTALSDERCLDVARILGIDAGRVMLEIQAERARKGGRQAVAETIEEVLRKLGGIAAALLLFLGLCHSAPDTIANMARVSQTSYARRHARRCAKCLTIIHIMRHGKVSRPSGASVRRPLLRRSRVGTKAP